LKKKTLISLGFALKNEVGVDIAFAFTRSIV